MAEMKVLTAFVDDPQQRSIDTYRQHGGYSAISKAIPAIAPDALIEMIKTSELRGRGGAGFMTGLKWSFVPKGDHLTKYLVCNCDESEPGTFKDRYMIEHDPHQLIEGIILASYAIGARRAFIYCRGEFFLGRKILEAAVKEAYSHGLLGKELFGSTYSLELIVHPGAGAYIAGEETAQLNSLEGFRATPRLKPPFPATSGLYGQPTVVNNVESLCNVVHIVNRGVEWFQSIGKPKNRGTKIFQLSGHVQKPGCYEFPLGTPFSEIFAAAGGCLPGRKLKAFFPGGSSCSLLTASDLDVTMEFETLAARGSALGTASIIVMDDSTDMVKVAHRLAQFYQNESCGKCTPCREGTRWVVQMLARIERGEGTYGDLKVIKQVGRTMELLSFCPLGVTAVPPIASAIKNFPEEFEAYIARNPRAHEPLPMAIAYPYLQAKEDL
jgi:NADH-quinone oxidoreductase subunit F